MRIVIAPDSYKGSLSAREVAAAMQAGVLRACPNARIRCLPMADGGEGTVEALLAARGGSSYEEEVRGPLGQPVRASYGILADGETAVIEVATAAGLTLVAPQERNPLKATSFGVGQLMRSALDRSCTRLIVGLGGSATNDGGMGLAQALGVRFLDANGEELGDGGGELQRLDAIDLTALDPRLQEIEVVICCDVTNPLCGPAGASAVFGPQKGATPAMVAELDRGLARYAAVLRKQLGLELLDVPGTGAAGGMTASLLAFANARLQPGAELIMEAAGLEEAIAASELVFTGEGRTDAQTAYGKVPASVAALAARHGKQVICLSGGLGEGYEALHALGVTACFSILDRPMALEQAMQEAPELITRAAEQAMRLLTSYREKP